jgi:hypothetical protein
MRLIIYAVIAYFAYNWYQANKNTPGTTANQIAATLGQVLPSTSPTAMATTSSQPQQTIPSSNPTTTAPTFPALNPNQILARYGITFQRVSSQYPPPLINIGGA